MNKYLIYSIIPAALTLGSLNVTAKEFNQDNCGGTETVQVSSMGDINEVTLKQHINETRDRLKRHATRGYWQTERNARSHLESMRRAMIRLHDQMVENGCNGAAHGASLGTRVRILEERISGES